jgi:hypothetical protein
MFCDVAPRRIALSTLLAPKRLLSSMPAFVNNEVAWSRVALGTLSALKLPLLVMAHLMNIQLGVVYKLLKASRKVAFKTDWIPRVSTRVQLVLVCLQMTFQFELFVASLGVADPWSYVQMPPQMCCQIAQFFIVLLATVMRAVFAYFWAAIIDHIGDINFI